MSAECERPLFDDEMSFMPLSSGGLGRLCRLLRHRSRWRIRPRIRRHRRRRCGPPIEGISPCSGGPFRARSLHSSRRRQVSWAGVRNAAGRRRRRSFHETRCPSDPSRAASMLR
jgi:hypothetical protein